MNIRYFGDGVWAYKNLLKIIKASLINLKFICLRYKKPDKKIKKISKLGEVTSSQKKYFIVNTGKGLIKILNWHPKINIKKGHVFL